MGRGAVYLVGWPLFSPGQRFRSHFTGISGGEHSAKSSYCRLNQESSKRNCVFSWDVERLFARAFQRAREPVRSTVSASAEPNQRRQGYVGQEATADMPGVEVADRLREASAVALRAMA